MKYEKRIKKAIIKTRIIITTIKIITIITTKTMVIIIIIIMKDLNNYNAMHNVDEWIIQLSLELLQGQCAG